MKIFFRLIALLSALLTGVIAQAQNYEFAALRGYPQMNTSGWTLAGMAYTGSTPAGDGTPSELILTTAINNTSGAAFFNTPVDVSRCQTWIAEFDYRIFDGTSADGIGFFFLAEPPRGFVRGGGLGIPTNNRGLVVALDQYQNGNCYGGSVPKLEIRYVSPSSNYNECPAGPPQPTIGGVAEVRQPVYNTLKIRYDNGNIEVYINNVLRLTGNYNIDFTGYFGVTASTGGQTDIHSVKNFSLKTFRPILSPPNAGPNITICNGGTGQIGTPVAPNDPYTYHWTPSTGLSDPNSPNPTVTINNNSGAPQVYTYFLVKDTAGSTPRCAYASEVRVTVLGRAATAGSDISICSGESRSLNLSPTSGYSYRWFPSTGLSNPFTANPTLTLVNNTTTAYTVPYIITANNPTLGCQESDTLLVTVLPKGVDAGPDLSICSGQTAQLGGPGLQNFLYSWAPSTGLSNPNSSRPSLTLTNTGNGVLRYRYVLTSFSTIGSCNTYDTVWVSVYPNPRADVGQKILQVCHGQQVTLGTPAQSGMVYQWQPATGLSAANVAQPTFKAVNQFGVPEIKKYKLTVTSPFAGCVSVDSIEITVNPLPLADAGGDVTVCEGGQIGIGSAAIQGYTYRWLPDSGLNNPSLANPVLTARLNGNTSIERQYIVEVIENGCSSFDTVSVTINAKPAKPVYQPVQATCDGTSLMLLATLRPNQSISWSPGSLLSDSTVPNPIFRTNWGNTTPINQWLRLTTKDQTTGCTRVDSLLINVNPKLRVNLPDVAACPITPTRIGVGLPTNGTYTWSPATYLTNTTVASPQFTWPTFPVRDTTLTYIVQIVNTQGCTASDTINVTVGRQPVADAGQDRLELCQDDSATIGTAALQGYSYSWSPTTGLNNPNAAQPRVNLASATPGIIRYVVQARLGSCFAYDTVEVLVKPKPNSLLPNLISVCNDEQIQIQNPPLQGYVYRWNTRNGLSDSTIANPLLRINSGKSYDTTYYYVLEVNNPTNGCHTVDTMGVVVRPLPTVGAGPDLAICPGDLQQLGTDSTAGYTYTWFPASGLSSTSAAKPYTTIGRDLGRDSTYQFTLSKQDLVTGCIAYDTVKVLVKAKPVLNLINAIQGCQNDTVRLGPAQKLAGAIYSWQPRTGLVDPDSATAKIFLSSTSATRQVFYLTITGPNGCSRTDSQVVVKNPLPNKPTIIGRSSFCPGIQGIGYRIGNQVAGNIYNWLITGGTIVNQTANGDSITVNWGATTSGRLTAVARSSVGCLSEPMFFDVQLKPILDVDKPVAVNQTDSICWRDANAVSYRAAPILPFSNYEWIVSPNGTIIGGQGTNVVTVAWRIPGRAEIYLRETSQTPSDTCLGVSDTLIQEVLPDLFIERVSVPPYACQNGQPTRFETQWAPGTRYVWSTPGGIIRSNFGPVVNVTYSLPGTYPVWVVGIGPAGCLSDTLRDTIVIEPQPVINWAERRDTICSSNFNGYTYRLTPQPGMQFHWSVNQGRIVSANTDSSVVTVNWFANAPIYQLRAWGRDAKGCESELISRSFFVETLGQELYSASWPAAGQADNAIAITYQATTSNRPFFLQRRNMLSADTSFVTVSSLLNGNNSYNDAVSNTGKYAYRLALVNSCGDTLYSNIHNPISLKVEGSPNNKRTVSLSWNAYRGWEAGSYQIYRSLEGSNRFELVDEVFASGESNFSITRLWGGDGFNQCFKILAVGVLGRSEETWSNQACIDFDNRPAVTNVVTPNGDGKNDVFELEYLDLYPNHKVTVFNRYGVEVANFKPYRNNWPEESVAAGTYFLLIDLGDGSAPSKTWIQVLR